MFYFMVTSFSGAEIKIISRNKKLVGNRNSLLLYFIALNETSTFQCCFLADSSSHSLSSRKNDERFATRDFPEPV